MLIHTPRLRLITCDMRHLEAIARDRRAIAEVTGVSIPQQWPGYPRAYVQALASLKKRPLLALSGWWLYLFINPALKTLVGSGGFKGAPTKEGIVEIGCEIAPVFQGEGYGSEALRGLAGYAFTRPEVTAVDAHSLPKKGAQSGMLKSVGLKHIDDAIDADAGKVWHWRVTAEQFAKAVLAGRR